MAQSLVEIANIALTSIGAELITSFEDPVKSAVLVKQNWPSCRDAVLRSYPWNCAVARTILAPLTEKPESKWAYQFNVPGDLLRLLEVEDNVEHAVEGRRIMADVNIIRIKYTRRIEDPSVYDALLTQALAAYLAHILSMPLVQSATLKDQMFQQYRMYCRQARSVDAQESWGQHMESEGWIEYRI